jgi:hypothetical protein
VRGLDRRQRNIGCRRGSGTQGDTIRLADVHWEKFLRHCVRITCDKTFKIETMTLSGPATAQ